VSQYVDNEGHFILVHGRLQTELTLLPYIDNPNIDNSQFFHGFFLQLAQYPSLQIVGGDLNCVLDTDMDRVYKKPVKTSQMAKALLLLMGKHKLLDIWRFKNPTSWVYDSFCMLDLFITSKTLVPRIESANYLTRSISDHSPLTLKLQGRWRLSPHMLTSKYSISEIKSAIKEYLDFNLDLTLSPITLWETLKEMIKDKIISSLATLKKESYEEINLKKLETEFYNSKSPKTNTQIASLHYKLDMLSTSRVEYALLMSKSKCYVQGDKVGKILA
uniref:Endonuclease/exonuclease/phosphatase domain-containing protein n=1 Tax=Latimeria chalumnae TaxID=7897 RepID=H3A7Y7_LATCH